MSTDDRLLNDCDNIFMLNIFFFLKTKKFFKIKMYLYTISLLLKKYCFSRFRSKNPNLIKLYLLEFYNQQEFIKSVVNVIALKIKQMNTRQYKYLYKYQFLYYNIIVFFSD